MADLAALAELGRLRRELGVDDSALDWLGRYDAADLRRFRRSVAEALAAPHRSAFRRAAVAARLLPAPLAAVVAERAFGPLLCSKIAAELEPAHAAKLVEHLDVGFLADLCRTLDPDAAGPVIAAIPDRRAVAVGAELYRRRDVDTVARFLDVVPSSVIPPMLDAVDDDEFLLLVAVAAESRQRLDDVFARLSDERIVGVVHAAATSDHLAEAVLLVGELGHEQAGRALELVVADGELLVTDLVAEISRLGGWDELLPVLAGLDPEVLAGIAASPALDRPELFRAVAEDVIAAGLASEVVALVGSMPPARQEQLATSLAQGAPAVAGELQDLVETVPGAADLPAARALRAALAR